MANKLKGHVMCLKPFMLWLMLNTAHAICWNTEYPNIISTKKKRQRFICNVFYFFRVLHVKQEHIKIIMKNE